ncbi:MAG: M48 family metalloprotease [Pyramidobacter sp.]|jgi:predicted Zn-dependent protease
MKELKMPCFPLKILRRTFKTTVLVLLLSAVCGLCGDPSWARRKGGETSAEKLAQSVKRECKIGRRIAEEIAEHMDFVEDPLVTARVRGIFNRLVPWVSRPLPYQVHIVREKSPNAFCIPGGYVYVTTGLLDFVRSDAELAFVMAHELSHASGKHGIIQMERNQKLSLAALAVAIASRGAGAAMVLSNAAAMAISNAYSRDLEQEADLGAVDVAEKAGYDLTAGITVMEGLAAEELKMPWIDPTIPLDHPKIEERLQYIASAIEQRGHVIHRKRVLKVLHPSVTVEKGVLLFKVDDTELLRGKATPALKKYCDRASKVIDESLQMETSVYDINCVRKNGGDFLCIGVTELMKSPVPDCAVTLKTVRQRLVAALGEARKKHPMTNYAL